MNREILADNGYSLSVNSFLFAILVDHIADDMIEISFDDFESKRIQFWNRGKQCYYCFAKDELCDKLDNSYKPYINSIGRFKWAVDMAKVFSGYNNFVNSIKEKDLKLFYYDEFCMKVYYLFDLFQIDIRIFDSPYHSVTALLKCRWMFYDRETYSDALKHQEFLFKISKRIKPNGNNVELLKICDELSRIECQELRCTDIDGKMCRLNDEKVEKSIEEKIDNLKLRVLRKKED